MKVCVDARMIFSSGIGTIIQNFFLNFSGEFKLTAIGNTTDIEPFLEGKENWEIVQSKAPIYSIKEQLSIFKLIPPCDVFWSPHYNIPILPIKAKRLVVNINDVFHLAHGSSMTLLQRLYSKMLIWQAVNRSDKIITISNFSVKEIIKFCGISDPTKIEMIYCGLDNSLFKMTHDEDALIRVRNKYNLPDRYILCVGNIKPHKNLRTLIKAFSKLHSSTFIFKLIIVGKKEGFINGDPLLFEEISNNKFLTDKIFFTGFVPNNDLPYLYNLASLFVFPSLYEGFGLPPLEAMACGCPVLVSDAASIPEICGDGARYFDPHSPEDLADKIQECLVLKDNKAWISKGLDRVSFFSWSEYYRKQIELFKEILK